MFRALQKCRELLNVVPGDLWSVSETILEKLFGFWDANCRLQAACGAARRPLVSLRQLLGTFGQSLFVIPGMPSLGLGFRVYCFADLGGIFVLAVRRARNPNRGQACQYARVDQNLVKKLWILQ